MSAEFDSRDVKILNAVYRHNRKIGYEPVKNEQTGTDPCLFRFRGHRRLWPQNLKKHGSVPIPKT